MDTISIVKPTFMQADSINRLIIDVFMKCIAPDYSKEGIDFFMGICTLGEIEEKLREETPIYVAKSGNNIVGVLWTRGIDHISRYFVDCAYQKKGIGRKLFDQYLAGLQTRYPEVAEITVNSSPFAEKAYERLGFQKTDEEKVGNGMRFIPMVWRLSRN